MVSEWKYLAAPFGDADNTSLFHHIESLAVSVCHNKYTRACAAGAIGGVVASAVSTGGLTMVAGATGGCIAATLGY